MSERRQRTYSVRGPIVLFVIVMILIVTLTVLWNVTLVHDYQLIRELAAQSSGAFHGVMIALGSVLFLSIITLSCVLIAQLVHNIRWAQRQSEFIASVSHELNSPLASIKLFAQTLRDQNLSTPNRAKFVDNILFDVDRLAHIVSNILRAAEIDHDRGELHVAVGRVELHQYLQDYVDRALSVESEKLEIKLKADGEVWVDLDPLMFRQVLDNLIDNAVRYRSGDRTNVSLHLDHDQTHASLDVRDEGIGVPRTVLRKLFDRFFRVDRDQSEPTRRGMGIGLSVVRSIIAGHSGTVSAHSEGLGHGTTINLTLPLRDAPRS